MFNKETYWTEKSIDEVSQKFLSYIKKNVKTKNYNGLPKYSALIIIDMQEYFLSEKSHAFISSASATKSRIKKLVDLFVKENKLVIFTKHLNNKENSGMMDIWWKDNIEISSPLSEINKDIIRKEIIIIEKSQYDPFYKTNLLKILTNYKINNIVVAGVLTNLCCETAIRSAFVNGFNTIFPIDTTATYNSLFHLASFINLSYGFTIPVLSKEIIDGIIE